jgi:TonB family protein
MKRYTLIFLLLCSFTAFAQRDTIYLYANQDFKQVAKADAKIIFKMFQRDGGWVVARFNDQQVILQEEMYLDSLLSVKNGSHKEYRDGRLSLSGMFSNSKKDGKFITYMADGKIREMDIFHQDTLKSRYYYHPDGAKKEERIYENGMMVISTSFRGEEEAKSEVLTYDNQEQLKSRIVYYLDGKTIGINETFVKGKLITGSYFDLEGKPTKKFQMEEPPTYPGGIEKFYEFIDRNLNYPNDALSPGVHTVYLSFTITETGELEDVKIGKGISFIIDREVLRVVKLAKKWIPANQMGKAVKVKYNVPIRFEKK